MLDARGGRAGFPFGKWSPAVLLQNFHLAGNDAAAAESEFVCSAFGHVDDAPLDVRSAVGDFYNHGLAGVGFGDNRFVSTSRLRVKSVLLFIIND